jgi:hypothetical protein
MDIIERNDKSSNVRIPDDEQGAEADANPPPLAELQMSSLRRIASCGTSTSIRLSFCGVEVRSARTRPGSAWAWRRPGCTSTGLPVSRSAR